MNKLNLRAIIAFEKYLLGKNRLTTKKLEELGISYTKTARQVKVYNRDEMWQYLLANPDTSKILEVREIKTLEELEYRCDSFTLDMKYKRVDIGSAGIE